MIAGQKAYWNHLYVVILAMAGLNAVIKVIGKQGRGNRYTVPFKELKPEVKYKGDSEETELISGCPECGLSKPNYQDGMECPSCHFKSGFREWLSNNS